MSLSQGHDTIVWYIIKIQLGRDNLWPGHGFGYVCTVTMNSEIWPWVQVTSFGHRQLEWGCPNGTKYPPRQPIQAVQVMHQIGEAVMRQKPFSVILALWHWPLDPKVHRVYTRLMGSLHVNFHQDRCKEEAVMRQKPFSVFLALWPWLLTFWPQSP